MLRNFIYILLTSIVGSVSASEFAVVPCHQCHSNTKVLGQHLPVDSSKKIDDCIACHSNPSVGLLGAHLHTRHTGKVPCSACHEVKNDKLLAKGSAIPLGDVSEDLFELYGELANTSAKGTAKLHETKKVSCSSCHGVKTPQEGDMVDNAVCEKCHGTQAEIAKRTIQKIKEQNPHASHQGALPCSKCHAGHTEAKSYCNECHTNFEQIMPESKNSP